MRNRAPRVVTESQAARVAGDGIEALVGVSERLVGAPELVVGKLTIDAGVRVGAHTHTCDTAAYVISGRAAFDFGEALQDRIEAGPGDHIYMPAGMLHTEQTLGEDPLVVVLVQDSAGGETVYRDGDPLG